ncbi:MAG: hypothetical protein K1X28_03960 [Parachlamydiales bacterium]|nr:hypothetical protein [Parachlamydiales bacterium]
MSTVPIFIRYSDQNVVLDKVADLAQENNLIFNHEGPFKTTFKFALLTLASPLITLAHLVRSAVFLFAGDGDRAGREFVGALGTQLYTLGCFIGSLLSSLIYVISSGQTSFHGTLRRTYAYFESWVNNIDWKSDNLPTYAHRVTGALDFANVENNRIWTTAPCMQPMLENGHAREGGILDPERIQRMFPMIKVNDVIKEGDDFVIQSEYEDEHVRYVGCNGAFEHSRTVTDCCCCYRVEAVYDRCLCCEVGRGTCRSTENHGDSCGVVGCGACGCGACCCYVKEDNQLVAMNTGCFGPEGFYCVTGLERKA